MSTYKNQVWHLQASKPLTFSYIKKNISNSKERFDGKIIESSFADKIVPVLTALQQGFVSFSITISKSPGPNLRLQINTVIGNCYLAFLFWKLLCHRDLLPQHFLRCYNIKLNPRYPPMIQIQLCGGFWFFFKFFILFLRATIFSRLLQWVKVLNIKIICISSNMT